MRQRPDTAALLRAARQALLDEVVPQLSSRAKYAALMVASAMATAGRDLDSGQAPAGEELALFRALYGAEAVAAAGDDPDAALLALNRRLAKEIREGKWDGIPDGLKALLIGQVRLRLARTNPKYLGELDSG